MQSNNVAVYISQIPINNGYGGERIRARSIIQVLSNMFDKVIVVTPKKPEDNYFDDFDNIDYIEVQSFSLENLTSIQLVKSYFLTNPKVIEVVKNLEPDFLLLDYAFIGQYLKSVKKYSKLTFYGTHNVQFRLTRQRKTSGFLDYLKKELGVLAQYIHEKMYFNNSDAIIVVSSQDAKYYEPIHKNVLILPNFIDTVKYSHLTLPTGDRTRLVMCANFEVYQNILGWEWFVKNIFPIIHDLELEIVVAGKGSDKLDLPLGGISLGTFESLSDVYTKKSIAMAPLVHGEGSRLKIIEACALGIPIISTTKGAEGIKSKGILMDDSIEGWKVNIKKLIENEGFYNECSRYVLDSVQSHNSVGMATEILRGAIAHGH